MKDFLSTLTEDQLKQPVNILLDEGEIHWIEGPMIRGAVYGHKQDGPGDYEDFGTIEELKDAHGESFELNDEYKLIQAAGQIYFE